MAEPYPKRKTAKKERRKEEKSFSPHRHREQGERREWGEWE
jgi:hypothetical protein